MHPTPEPPPPLTGIHHLTAVSANIRDNHRFYTQVLGMRLVKRSVNQDDVSAYHLFYADAVASPGTDLTFFDWPLPRERRGTHSIARAALRVAGEGALAWWAARLAQEGVPLHSISERDGRQQFDFEDHEGQRLTLLDDGGAGPAGEPWAQSPVPAPFQLRGLGPVRLSVPRLAPTDQMLTLALGMRRTREYADGPRDRVQVYEMGAGGPAAEVHVVVQPDLPPARQGAGGVHHVAFRTPTDESYDGWAAWLNALGIPNSGKVDRYYFRSLYFREPNGILFEIATDGPGFATDEAAAHLGERLALPPFLEPQRAQIESRLKPLGA